MDKMKRKKALGSPRTLQKGQTGEGMRAAAGDGRREAMRFLLQG